MASSWFCQSEGVLFDAASVHAAIGRTAQGDIAPSLSEGDKKCSLAEAHFLDMFCIGWAMQVSEKELSPTTILEHGRARLCLWREMFIWETKYWHNSITLSGMAGSILDLHLFSKKQMPVLCLMIVYVFFRKTGKSSGLWEVFPQIMIKLNK